MAEKDYFTVKPLRIAEKVTGAEAYGFVPHGEMVNAIIDLRSTVEADFPELGYEGASYSFSNEHGAYVNLSWKKKRSLWDIIKGT